MEVRQLEFVTQTGSRGGGKGQMNLLQGGGIQLAICYTLFIELLKGGEI